MFDLLGEHPVAGVILACEVGLWVLLALGLALRYLARMRALSTVVLLCIPLLDVVLVAATAIDLHRGATADATHGLAGLYLGFSIAFGPTLVRWADTRVAHRFAGGPPPMKTPKHGPERRKYLWREWFRVVNAAAISSVTLLALVVFVASPDQDSTLTWWIGRVWVIVGLWFVFGPLWESGRGDKASDRKEPVDIAH
ncbi:hypothetical protein [Nocardia sp. NPDC050406]|uniref:hypothetical protein n=1 Tax=Nocardia sp. NPDC050406 TaxID=3364318 RepID=UPI00379F0ED2